MHSIFSKKEGKNENFQQDCVQCGSYHFEPLSVTFFLLRGLSLSKSCICHAFESFLKAHKNFIKKRGSHCPLMKSMSTLKHIFTDKAPKAIGPYSQAIVANGFVYTAGQIPLNPQTMTISGTTIQFVFCKSFQRANRNGAF